MLFTVAKAWKKYGEWSMRQDLEGYDELLTWRCGMMGAGVVLSFGGTLKSLRELLKSSYQDQVNQNLWS